MTHPNAKPIICIGNALMDIIAPVPEQFLIQEGITKASMALIDAPRAADLTQKLQAFGPREIAGGSAANTAVGLAQLGCKATYISRVCDDELGQRFTADLRATGVVFNPKKQSGGLPTGRCHIAVTPDGERSMSTLLGASSQFERSDIPNGVIAAGGIIYLEGYLFSSPEGKAAFYEAAKLARASGVKVALTLSDSFCVQGHHADFVDFTKNHVDILFANADEAMALFETDDFEQAVSRAGNCVEIAALTRGEKGAVIASSTELHVIPAGSLEPYEDKSVDRSVDKPVDTTGAGDQFAAGFLAGLSRNKPLDVCGQWGVAMATEVITHYGARVENVPELS